MKWYTVEFKVDYDTGFDKRFFIVKHQYDTLEGAREYEKRHNAKSNSERLLDLEKDYYYEPYKVGDADTFEHTRGKV